VILALDFVPDAVHAPMYTSVEQGRDRERGVRLEIGKPGPGPDSPKLVASGRVDIGVRDTCSSNGPTSMPGLESSIAAPTSTELFDFTLLR
jgi:ABC-type nitrate/sulfonate/bicarbonate transport system substrate-binding protein